MLHALLLQHPRNHWKLTQAKFPIWLSRHLQLQIGYKTQGGDVLAAIVSALAAAAERAMREGAGDGALRHFADEESAARFLEEYSITGSNLFSANLAPLHKWLQAIYLTDGGTIPVGPHHLAEILDVPLATAWAMSRTLASARTS